MSNVTVSANRDLLIIGKAANNNNLKEVVYAEYEDDVVTAYGESDLTKAFRVAKELGAPYVFLMNIQHDYQYLDIIEVLKQNDFAYIAFASLYLSDMYDDEESGRRLPYLGYMLEQIGQGHESVFLTTDKHASLFEDIDAFLEEMNRVSSNFYYGTDYPANFENVVFVANNLKGHAFGNIAVAAALCASDIKDYPVADYGDAIFDIDAYEEIDNYAYFMNHSLRETTVENLLNYRNGTLLKVVTISRIIKAIKRSLDFSEYIGTPYSDHIPIAAQKKLKEYLQLFVSYGWIYRWNINSVLPFRTDHSGTVTIESSFDVWPATSFEKCRIDKNIEVS